MIFSVESQPFAPNQGAVRAGCPTWKRSWLPSVTASNDLAVSRYSCKESRAVR